ncbi:MAG TPA: pyridoxamine 5'-phosphate oxidase family protein [Gemmatimonadales bacterium]
MLRTAATGTLATLEGEQPFLNSNLFVFDEFTRAIYLHSTRIGRTRDNIDRDRRVCFCVMELGRLLPASTALEFSCEYASVVVFGSGTVVHDRVEATRALQLLLDKYFPDLSPGTDYRAITDEELDRTAVFRIAIEEWSGKRKRVPGDFPGARAHGAPSMLGEEPNP